MCAFGGNKCEGVLLQPPAARGRCRPRALSAFALIAAGGSAPWRLGVRRAARPRRFQAPERPWNLPFYRENPEFSLSVRAEPH